MTRSAPRAASAARHLGEVPVVAHGHRDVPELGIGERGQRRPRREHRVLTRRPVQVRLAVPGDELPGPVEHGRGVVDPVPVALGHAPGEHPQPVLAGQRAEGFRERPGHRLGRRCGVVRQRAHVIPAGPHFGQNDNVRAGCRGLADPVPCRVQVRRGVARYGQPLRDRDQQPGRPAPLAHTCRPGRAGRSPGRLWVGGRARVLRPSVQALESAQPRPRVRAEVGHVVPALLDHHGGQPQVCHPVARCAGTRAVVRPRSQMGSSR